MSTVTIFTPKSAKLKQSRIRYAHWLGCPGRISICVRVQLPLVLQINQREVDHVSVGLGWTGQSGLSGERGQI